MATDSLTDRNFWMEYWKGFVATPVKENNFPATLLNGLPGPGSRYLEIGGFPGTSAAFFKKFHDYEVTLLDFVAVPAPIRSVERANDLPAGSIQSIEADFLTYEPNQSFDVVHSAGFIEHFADTQALIRKHIDCLKPGGTLFITLPNLRGISGWALWLFDRKTYDAHNIDCMSIPLLSRICRESGLKSAQVFYHGSPWIWMDRPELLSRPAKLLIKIVNTVIQRLPFKSRLISPVIVVRGIK